MFYATFTSILGYKPDSDEWKVMAMSAYKVKCNNYISKIKKTYKLKKSGELELNLKYFSYSDNASSHNLYSKELLKLLKISNVSYKSNPDIEQIKIAKALQYCAEEIAVHFLNHLYKITNCKNLVLSGGFFMNSVFNGKIEKKTKFKKVFISHSPTDTGNSIGSALFLYYHILNKKKFVLDNSPYLSGKFNNEEILKAFKKRNIKYKKIKNFAKEVAKNCFEGNIVAFFRNRLEFGDRALGCRSILADPRSEKMKSKINQSIKYRESYRPFAPAIIDDKKNIYFDISKNDRINYMEKVVKVKKKFQKKLQAITHFDGSARVQTVSKKNNFDFYQILKEFEKYTSYPILLNTSFNINGEPIVYSPDDALNTFYNSKLDILVIGDYLVKK
jgi:carbamoyltransferase